MFQCSFQVKIVFKQLLNGRNKGRAHRRVNVSVIDGIPAEPADFPRGRGVGMNPVMARATHQHEEEDILASLPVRMMPIQPGVLTTAPTFRSIILNPSLLRL